MLKVSDLHVNYGPLAALRGVSFEIARGEIVCFVGANGAGKSTALNVIAGGVVPRSGSINFEGHELAGMRPEAIAHLGITLVPEGRHVFGTLTVRKISASAHAGTDALPCAISTRLWSIFLHCVNAGTLRQQASPAANSKCSSWLAR